MTEKENEQNKSNKITKNYSLKHFEVDFNALPFIYSFICLVLGIIPFMGIFISTTFTIIYLIFTGIFCILIFEGIRLFILYFRHNNIIDGLMGAAFIITTLIFSIIILVIPINDRKRSLINIHFIFILVLALYSLIISIISLKNKKTAYAAIGLIFSVLVLVFQIIKICIFNTDLFYLYYV